MHLHLVLNKRLDLGRYVLIEKCSGIQQLDTELRIILRASVSIVRYRYEFT